MLNFLQILLKRPTDATIRKWKLFLGMSVMITGIIAFGVQNLEIHNPLFGITFSQNAQEILKYVIIGLGIFPILSGGLDINLFPKKWAKILQIIYGVILMMMPAVFVDSPYLTVDVMYVILGLGTLLFWITGKAVTQKGQKKGQKITKIRV